MPKLSRAKIAAYFAGEIAEGKPNVIERLTALVINENRLRDLELIVADIEYDLARRGIVVADVVTARPLDESLEASVRELLAHRNSVVHLRTHVDPHVIGGVRIRSAGRELDTTVRHKLNQLKAQKALIDSSRGEL